MGLDYATSGDGSQGGRPRRPRLTAMPSDPTPTLTPGTDQIRPGPAGEQYPHKGKGLVYASVAFGWWALVIPSFFGLLNLYHTDPLEIVSQRVLFGVPVLLVMLAFRRQLGVFLRAATTWTSLKVLIPSTALIGINWYAFIYAISTDRLSHASLGYYINPLVSIALGFVFLGERLRPVQWGAIALAGVAVLVLGAAELTAGESRGLPWISVMLPASFGIYGLLRKQANVGASVGLCFEMLLLLPVGLGLVIWLHHSGRGTFLAPETPVWLSGVMLLSGVVTIVPLICFTNAVRLLPLSTVGLMQYVTPTGQLLLSLLLFNEHFTALKFAAFGIIWLAVGIYTWDMLRGHREMRAARTELLE